MIEKNIYVFSKSVCKPARSGKSVRRMHHKPPAAPPAKAGVVLSAAGKSGRRFPCGGFAETPARHREKSSKEEKRNMNIVILSGGSGNDAFVRGLMKYAAYSEVKIRVIVNAYDNGKSTGVCRAVTDTLGVSDIRKNHIRMYEAVRGAAADKNILEFYEKRYDFTAGKEEEEIAARLGGWGMPEYIPYVQRFFRNERAHSYAYKDFCVSNIVYAQMYKELGYEATNKHFCDRLGIEDFVVLNSFDNVFIKAQTEHGHLIEDEGETVFWNNPNDKIVKTVYDVRSHVGLNPRAVALAEQADYIIISTGTFWSSLQPTIEYLDFYKHLNASKAKKVWVLNNEEDGDSFGVTSLELVRFMEKTGLDLSAFSILVNTDACPSLRMTDGAHNFVRASMGNIKGKHDSARYAETLLRIYYGLQGEAPFDRILMDFDDTVWARGEGEEEVRVSEENVKLINSRLAEKAVIISGNSYRSIHEKLRRVYGEDLSAFRVDIWADANSTLYRGGRAVEVLEGLVIGAEAEPCIRAISEEIGRPVEQLGVKPVCYKIKPLSEQERRSLAERINARWPQYFKAKCTGKTTVDILHKNNNKIRVFEHCGFETMRTLYIGDEVSKGNDAAVSRLCTRSVSVKSAAETNLVLHLLTGEQT